MRSYLRLRQLLLGAGLVTALLIGAISGLLGWLFIVLRGEDRVRR